MQQLDADGPTGLKISLTWALGPWISTGRSRRRKSLILCKRDKNVQNSLSLSPV